MNLYEAQDFFGKLYAGKKIEYSFDENCHRKHEIIYTNGKPNVVHHVENSQVKVSVEGMDPFYVPIAPHRENIAWSYIKKIINAKDDIHLNPSEIDQLKQLEPEELQKAINQIAGLTGLSSDKIKEKIS